jgi:hypothetical protein
MSSNQYFAYRSFWPELETVARFRDAGVDAICIFASNTENSLGQPYGNYPMIWRWFERYDFSGFDQQIGDLVGVNPAAEFLVMVDLNSPVWLARQLSLMHENADSFTQLSQALCLPEWRKHVTDYLHAFLDYCEATYPERIKAYILACGHTDEWLDHTGGAAGKAKTRAFHEWQNKKQLPDQSVPDAIRLNSTDFDDLLHDPQEKADVMAYWRFTNEVVADSIVEFANLARQRIRPEVEIGVFYGYVMSRIGPVTSGHAEYERVLASPDIDFLISPGTYFDREIGGGSGFQTVAGSERLAGKRHMHECDQRTHTHNRDLSEFVRLEVPYWPDLQSDIAGIKREFALSLIEQNSLWWFDMWGGFYQKQEHLDTIAHCKALWDRFAAETHESIAEVAMIVDPDSLYYMDQVTPRQGEFNRHVRKQLNRLGAPCDFFAFNDLSRLKDLDRYKMLVFATPFEITAEKAKLLHELVLKNARAIVWLYAPGISDGNDLDVSRVKKWAGVKYGATGLKISDMGDWTAVYLHRPADLTPAMLKQIAAQCGVHLYCEAEQPVFANDQFLAVHSADGGSQKITLPCKAKKITELFSGAVAAENAEAFSWNLASPDTVLFKVDKA